MLRRCCCIAAAVLVVPIAGLVSLRAAAEAEGKGALSRIASDLARRARELDVATPFDPLIKDAHNRTNALRQYDVQSSGDAATRPADSRRSLEGLQAARHYFRLIHASQSPDVPDCRRRRLLLTQFPDDSYEGTGSVLSSLVISLAEAFYSNRTLIWGADLTPMLELTRPAWEKRRKFDRVPDLSTVVHGARLDCADSALGGGSFACIFQPLSPCSLADVTAAELVALASDARDPTARVAVMDHRRAVAAYVAPPLPSGAPGAGARWQNHLWAGALATYVFRPQPAVRAHYEATRGSLDGGEWAADTACMHVRHGDVLHMPTVYQNREAFPFSDYFRALRSTAPVAHLQGEEPGAAPPVEQPGAIFVASDSPDAGNAIAEARLDSLRNYKEGQALPPPILSVSPAAGRFVTLYGSHTVAAGSGVCSRTRCGLPYGALDHFDALLDSSGPSRPARLLQVFFEAAEDLHLLSRCTRLATTASSRYGAIAASLIWAATGGAGVPATAFLDIRPIASGELQNAWLHWSTNGTNRAVPGARWLSFSRLFIEGLWSDEEWAGSSRDVGVVSGPPLISMRSFIPAVPSEMFWPEVVRMLGLLRTELTRGLESAPGEPLSSVAVSANALQQPRLWPGECPLLPDGVVDTSTQALAIVAQINGGVQHLDQNHLHQAVMCWSEASRLLKLVIASPASERDGSLTPDMERDYGDVIRGNQAAVAAQHGYPYGQLRLAAMHQLIARNIPAAASALGLPGGRTESTPAFPRVSGREGAGGWVPKRAQ